MNRTDEIAATHLGKKSEGSETYNPSLLVAIPRFENRKQYNIQNNNLPFEGWDVWHAYEFSAMTENGIPVTRLMKLKYNCTSEFLVESKSLKLYLNSFNMTKFGNTITECLEICKKTIEKDLSEKLETEVTVNFIENKAERFEIFTNFENIMNSVDEKTLKVEKFKEAPELLQTEETEKEQTYHLMFDSLRSNCRVTHQPDFGDLYLYYRSKKHILEDSIVKYLSSFRSEYHFHEECCEMIYKRLLDLLDSGDELFVCALYTRRGGIDICPVRTNCILDDALKLIDLTKFARGSIKQ
ncbi:gTP cyclohydrolase I/Nitrile oxidoreductase [Fusobacterium sp. CAG:439]|nr:gTP cyclohydrolase I/Nitrile oxidoreductase [Fusobacterium sp. CAG:439]